MEDAAWVTACGADFVGLNFYPRSPRFITEQIARKIVNMLPKTTKPVALVVEQEWKDALELASTLGIDRLQIHGDHREPPPHQALPFIPAFSVKDEASLTRIRDYLNVVRAGGVVPFAILVDAHVAGMHGGTGRTAPWDLLSDFDPGVPLILAGGLTPENVAEAVRKVRPWGVDVASGVESAPGIKDAEKVKRFIENAREAGESSR